MSEFKTGGTVECGLIIDASNTITTREFVIPRKDFIRMVRQSYPEQFTKRQMNPRKSTTIKQLLRGIKC